MKTFPNYYEWRSAITGPCALSLTAAYCLERMTDLGDPKNPSTKSFTQTYGETYLAQVVSWFQQAESEARE